MRQTCRIRGSLQHLTSATLALNKGDTRQLAMAVQLETKSAETVTHDPVMKDHFLGWRPLTPTSANDYNQTSPRRKRAPSWDKNTLTLREKATLSVTPTEVRNLGTFHHNCGDGGGCSSSWAMPQAYLMLYPFRLCLGQGADIWAYIIQHVRSQR